MKEYTAVHYVHDHHGSLHTPGEVFEAEYDDAAEERLLRLGAVIVSEDQVSSNVRDEVIEDEEIDETVEFDESIVIDVMEGITEKPKRGRKK